MPNAYSALVAAVFETHYHSGMTEFIFTRTELQEAADRLGIPAPKNLGDVLYSFRFREPLPPAITSTEPPGKEWVIKLAGKGAYKFQLVDETRVIPSASLVVTKIPDATPEIISQHALDDEQALLAKVRYNRLIDVFLGVVAYSLQSHLRTTVRDVGQIEIDEVYLSLDRNGAQYIVPVQAKGGTDRIALVQTEQDLAWCHSRFPGLVARAIAAQFMEDDVIALFELGLQDGQVRIIEERHYQLVESDAISDDDLQSYRRNVST